MNITRNATAVWKGSGKEGSGHLSTQSTVLQQTQYSFNTRFADGKGTNPEELIAAAHAGCFTMKLSFVLAEKGFTADELNTKCTINFENGSVTKSELELSARIPNIAEDVFRAAVKDAEQNCPISKLLNTSITTNARLV